MRNLDILLIPHRSCRAFRSADFLAKVHRRSQLCALRGTYKNSMEEFQSRCAGSFPPIRELTPEVYKRLDRKFRVVSVGGRARISNRHRTEQGQLFHNLSRGARPRENINDSSSRKVYHLNNCFIKHTHARRVNKEFPRSFSPSRGARVNYRDAGRTRRFKKTNYICISSFKMK